jgi:hypothetical protein
MFAASSKAAASSVNSSPFGSRMRTHIKVNFKLALTLLAGVALGGAVIQTIHAQSKPPTYVVVAIRKINDAVAYKTSVVDKAPAAMANSGAKICRSHR